MFFEAPDEILTEDRLILSTAMLSVDSSFRQYKVYADIRGVLWRESVKLRYGGRKKRRFSVTSVAVFVTFKDNANVILAICRQLFTDPKMLLNGRVTFETMGHFRS